MRYQEDELENSSDLLEIHRERSHEAYAGAEELQQLKENRSLVSLDRGGAEVRWTLLNALKTTSFPTCNLL